MERCDGSDTCNCYNCLYRRMANYQLQGQHVAAMQVQRYSQHYMKHCIKVLKRDSALSGHKWVWELWHGNDNRFFSNMRMRKPVLRRLISELVRLGGLNTNPKWVTLEESMAMFLLIIGQGMTYPMVEERLQCSSETLSRHFHKVLDAVCTMGRHIIKPVDPTFSEVPSAISTNPLYWPYFGGCIGALDGTHIALHIPDGIKSPWMNRKGFTSTNVMAICDFEMCVTFVTIGMEGCMHDTRVLTETINRNSKSFPYPPDGKYYLVDAGYPLMQGYLTPYRKIRYHLGEYRANRKIKNDIENFNYRHSSLRYVIELTFGILKKRWRVLNTMAMVSLEHQLKIIYACFVLHNFIRRYDADDLIMLESIPQGEGSSTLQTDAEHEDDIGANSTMDDLPNMTQVRDMIKDSISYIGRERAQM